MTEAKWSGYGTPDGTNDGLSRTMEKVESTLPHPAPVTDFDRMAHLAGVCISEMADRYLGSQHGGQELSEAGDCAGLDQIAEPGEKIIRVLKVEPGTAPEIVTMPNTLDALQAAVGGYIEAVTLDANSILVCNEEGKLTGLPANRQVGGDTIAGTFLIVGAEDGDFASLSDADAAYYAEKFAQPMPVHSPPDELAPWEFYVI